MRGIKVGNFLTYKNSIVCIVSNISEGEGENKIITGRDSNNNIHQGPQSQWSTVILNAAALKTFTDDIFNNIISYRVSKAR